MLRPARTTTPGILVVAAVGVVLAGIVAGLVGWAGLSARAGSLDDARAETQHQVRLQTARTKLVIADTAAGRDVLLGGGDRGSFSFRDYDIAMQPALINMVYAASEPQDRAKLAVADRYAALYAMQVERARTLAATGNAPLAATTMEKTSAVLHKQVLPRLQEVQTTSEQRLRDDDNSAGRGPLIALVVVLLALAGLSGVQWWLTLRTRRLVNIGLASAATVLLLVMLVAAGSVIGSLSTARDVREGPQTLTTRLVEARIAAFDARSIKALAVIRGDVPAAQQEWQTAMDRANASLAAVPGLATSLGPYERVHAAMLKDTRRQATINAAVNPANGSVGAFDDFDAVTGAELARQVQHADDGWVAALGHLRLIGWVTLVAGLLAAVLAWWGVEQRRREYR